MHGDSSGLQQIWLSYRISYLINGDLIYGFYIYSIYYWGFNLRILQGLNREIIINHGDDNHRLTIKKLILHSFSTHPKLIHEQGFTHDWDLKKGAPVFPNLWHNHKLMSSSFLRYMVCNICKYIYCSINCQPHKF